LAARKTAFRWDFDLVIFDLDGTLIDSSVDIANSVNVGLQAVGLAPWSVEKIKTFIGHGTRSLVEQALQNRLDLFEKAFEAFTSQYARTLNDHTDFFPGVREVLDLLGGSQKAIMSNKRQIFCDSVVDYLKIRPYFSLVLGGDMGAGKKPDAAPLLYICEKLNVSPDRTVMVGDSDMDVLAGKAAGASTVGLTEGFTVPDVVRAARPDLLAPNVASLKEVILRERQDTR
jgi:phosphoglycolate phosphatase